MGLEQLIQAALPSKLEVDKPISPTLIVGLGGSGKEVLLRFRRLVVERYGSLDELPFIQFLHIDTDRTRDAQEQYDLKREEDPLFDQIRFQPAERVDLKIEGGTGKYRDHIGRYPHIKRWFHTDGKIAQLGDLGEGAGQIRMASRLGFYHSGNFNAVAAVLDHAGGQLRDAGNLKKASALGFDLNSDSLEIVVAASLAGGTGSGVFLDVGFLLQKYFPGAARTGILLLPNFFRAYVGASRTRANGYAALTELNHYSFGHRFEGNWDGVNQDLLSPPPFSNTYLVEASNDAGVTIQAAGKEFAIYSMIAEFLFQDFSIGAFSGRKRATRVNLENFNLNVYTHNFLSEALTEDLEDDRRQVAGDTFPTRFAGFGLSSISFPTDRVQSACACRLARRILRYWETAEAEDPLEKLFTSFLTHTDVRFAQGSYTRRDGGGVIQEMQVEDALLWYEQSSGKTFQSYIWDRAQSIRTEIEAAENGEKADLLRQRRADLDQDLAKEDSTNPDEWGVWVRTLERNKREYLAKLLQGIREQAQHVANDPRQGVAEALSVLQELKALLRNDIYYYLGYFEENIGVWQGEMQRYSHDFDRLTAEVGEHEQERLFRKADLRRDIRLLVADSADSEELGTIYSYCYSRVMKQVCKRGREICREVDKLLGKDDATGDGLIGEYYKLLVGFTQVRDRLRHKEAYFSKKNEADLAVNLYQEGDVEAWYKIWVGSESGAEEAALRTVGNKLLEEVFEVPSVMQALAHIQSTPVEDIEHQIFGTCKSYFRRQETQPNALQMLFDNSRVPNPKDSVKLAYRWAQVWLAPAERGLEHTGLPEPRADQRPLLIGAAHANAALLKQLKDVVRDVRGPGDTEPSFSEIGEDNQGTIVFYNELAGVPAFYPKSVTAAQGLKESYAKHPDKAELHIDRNRFQFGDLIPKTDAESKRYVESIRAFVLARLLGLLKVREIRESGDERPTYHYSYRKSDGLTMEEERLGDELNAIDVLYRQSGPEHLTDRYQLRKQIEDALQTIQRKKLLHLYALLLEFYRDMVYPAVTESEWFKDQGLKIMQYPPEHAVIREQYRQIKRLLGSQQEREQLAESLRSLRGEGHKKLTYEQYKQELRDYTKGAGGFAVERETETGSWETVFRKALALDLSKIDEAYREKDAPAPVPAAKPPRRARPKRPCPNCGKDIPAPALFCSHCKQNISKGHTPCPSCEEQKVPVELASCWNCGLDMPSKQKDVQCPKCFEHTGPPSSYPCPVCGYSFDGPEAEASDAGGSGPAAAPKAARAEEPPPPPPGEELVECPNCYEEVAAGPNCPICSMPLG